MVLDGTPKKIIKLSTAVINKIAAGEIIHRPASAVKELIENSLDAEAKKISITVKEGGVKALQVQDTGNGIRKEDLSIVCKRFTTSKLREFEDLRRIRTFGFRGEALASISHVSHLSITTRTRTEQCAYKAFYCDGHLTSPQPGLSVEPVPCAGNIGTTICVEDLFYNMDTRRKTLKSSNEEYLKIHTVVCNYSINFPQVSFTLKKFGEAAADYRTPADSTSRSNIKAIYGQKVEAELLEIEQLEESLELGIVGLISNANFSLKRGVFVLFINGRLLECPAIRKAIDNVYSAHLPKHAHSFCYLSLTMNPANVDVNVHPTKNEVHFLHANRIIEVVQETTRARLLAESSSRTFYSQSFLSLPDSRESAAPVTPQQPSEVKMYGHHMVRTDHRSQTLHSFIGSPAIGDQSSPHHKRFCSEQDFVCSESRRLKRNPVNLTSVLECREAFVTHEDPDARTILSRHTFVGCVTRTLALIQNQTKLYLANVRKLSQELFFQLVFEDFGNFGLMKLSPTVSLTELLSLALNSKESGYSEEEHGPQDQLIAAMASELVSRADMLREYFMIHVTAKGVLETLPLVLPHYEPSWSKLPMFVLRMATEVDWSREVECFRSLALELSLFYAYEGGEGDELADNAERNWKWTVEHVLFPVIRKRLRPPASLLGGRCLVLIADLPDLYKVFERC